MAMRSRGTKSQRMCCWLAGTEPGDLHETRGAGMERRGRKWRTLGLRRAQSTRSPLTPRGLALSCSVVGAGAARSPTRGSGMARLGHRSRTPDRAPVVAMLFRTILHGRGSCSSAGRTRADCSATPGNGMAMAGHRSQTPVRLLAPVMPCVSRVGRRPRTVLFGGSDGSDTWTWNGTEWTGINDVGPEPRQANGARVRGDHHHPLWRDRSQLGRPASWDVAAGGDRLDGASRHRPCRPPRSRDHVRRDPSTGCALRGERGAVSHRDRRPTSSRTPGSYLPLPRPRDVDNRPILRAFQVNPTSSPRDAVQARGFLGQPAPVTTSVMVSEVNGVFVDMILVPAGSTSGQLSVNLPAAMPPGG